MKTTEEMIEVMQAYADGKKIEYYSPRLEDWFITTEPEWNWFHIDYRIALTQDSVDWSHVGSDLNAHARDKNGIGRFYEMAPHIISDYWHPNLEGTYSVSASVFASYKRGTTDWQDSLVERPKDE